MGNVTKPKDFKYVTGKKYDSMMGRCYRNTDKSYPNYGERGIKVCASWIKSIYLFRDWIRKELTIRGISEEEFVKNSRKWQLDRIDVNGHYTPENCRIIDAQTNTRNRRKFGREVVSAEGETITW